MEAEGSGGRFPEIEASKLKSSVSRRVISSPNSARVSIRVHGQEQRSARGPKRENARGWQSRLRVEPAYRSSRTLMRRIVPTFVRSLLRWSVRAFVRSVGRSVGRSHAGSFVTRSTYSGQRPTPQALPASIPLSLQATLSLAPLITLPFYNAPLCSATAEPCIFLDAMDFPKAFRCYARASPLSRRLWPCQTCSAISRERGNGTSRERERERERVKVTSFPAEITSKVYRERVYRLLPSPTTMETHRSLRDIIVDVRARASGSRSRESDRAESATSGSNNRRRIIAHLRNPARWKGGKEHFSLPPLPMYAHTRMENSSSITVARRQEIIKRYPEWRKY